MKNGGNSYHWNLLPIASRTQPTVPSPPQHITLKFSTSLNIVKPIFDRRWKRKQETKISSRLNIRLSAKYIIYFYRFFVRLSHHLRWLSKIVFRTHLQVVHLSINRTLDVDSACTGISVRFDRLDVRHFSDSRTRAMDTSPAVALSENASVAADCQPADWKTKWNETSASRENK